MKRRLSIVLLIFVMIIVLRLAGITYGYYSATIIDNANTNSLSAESKYLAVEYLDGTSIMNFDGDFLFPGDSAEKTFTVKNTGNATSTYNILIDNVINEFERTQDLRYVLYINNEEVTSGAVNNNSVQYLYSNREIAVGESDLIRFVFEYATTDEVQNIDMNKIISFRFNISGENEKSYTGTNSISYVSDGSVLNNYRIYGNSVQEGTPSVDVPVEIQSVGDLVTDESDANYGKYKIPIIVSGKNMVDPGDELPFTFAGITIDYDESTGVFLATGSGTNAFRKFNQNSNVKLKANTTYFFSIEMVEGQLRDDNSSQLYFRFHDENDTYIVGTSMIRNNTTKLRTGTFTPTSDINIKYFILWFYDNNNANSVLETLKLKLFLTEGTTDTEFEPFHEPLIYYVYLDEPLRKVGNYVDYIDLRKQAVVRNVKVIDESGITTIENSYVGLSTPLVSWINVPELGTIDGTNIFTVDTVTAPSKFILEID